MRHQPSGLCSFLLGDLRFKPFLHLLHSVFGDLDALPPDVAAIDCRVVGPALPNEDPLVANFTLEVRDVVALFNHLIKVGRSVHVLVAHGEDRISTPHALAFRAGLAGRHDNSLHRIPTVSWVPTISRLSAM